MCGATKLINEGNDVEWRGGEGAMRGARQRVQPIGKPIGEEGIPMSQRWQTLVSRSLPLAFSIVVLIAISFPLLALAAGPQASIRDILEAVSAVMHDPQLQ